MAEMPAEHANTSPALTAASPPPVALFLPVAVAAMICLAALAVVGQRGHLDLAISSPTSVFLLATLSPMALVAVVLALVRWPQAAAASLVFACIFFNETIERVSLSLGFFHVYPQDALLALALIVAAVRGRAAQPVRWTASPLGKVIAVAIVFAGFQAARGVVLGNEFSAAFGELRRGYIYMIAYFLVLAESAQPRRLRWLHGAFVAGSLAVVARGLYRLAAGKLFQMSWFDVFHVLGHSDLVFVTFISFYSLGRLVFPARQQRPWVTLFWLILLPVTLGLIVLGNFRASWIGFVLAGMVVGVLLPRHRRRQLVLAAIPLLGLVAAAFYAARNVRVGDFGETVHETLVAKFRDLIDYQTDPNIIWRIHSYRAGLRVWSEHPILGAGLGRRLVFHSINASGQQSVHFNHRVHNSLLWVGYSTGAIGLAIFLALHFTYFWRAARMVKRLGQRPEAGALLAYVAFYVAFMTVALFDVILEESATALVLYAQMALVFRLGESVIQEAQSGREG